MTLEEAIEILAKIFKPSACYTLDEGIKATVLGIEALKRIRTDRISPDVQVFKFLPGETEAQK